MFNITHRYTQVANVKRGTMRERIIRVLLTEPDGSLTKYQLAKKAECSFPWTHELLDKLDALGLVKGTKVKNYAGLLKYWLEVKTKPEKREYMHADPISLVKKAGMPYALTTYQAENLVQQYLFPSRTDLYIKREHAEKWHQLIATEGLVGKGNLRLLTADEHVFYGSFQRRGLTTVCIPQLIVDLLEEGGVCTEAAEKLIEKANQNAVRTE
jgi:DNA-binding Lrp family transcriptional regulator